MLRGGQRQLEWRVVRREEGGRGGRCVSVAGGRMPSSWKISMAERSREMRGSEKSLDCTVHRLNNNSQVIQDEHEGLEKKIMLFARSREQGGRRPFLGRVYFAHASVRCSE